MDAERLKNILDAKKEANKTRAAGFCMFSEEELVSKDEATKALMALYDVTFNPKPLMQAYRVYKKYVPVLLAHSANVNDFDQMLERQIVQLEKTTGERSNKRWTDDEDEWLVEQACKEEVSIFDIATGLGRTPSSIQARLTKLVGLHRLSEEIAGRFIGSIDGAKVEGDINGRLYKEANDAK